MRIIEKVSAVFSDLEEILKENGVFDFAYEERYFYFYGLGTFIRNHLLSQESELYRALCEYGIRERDDQSAIIITLFYLYMKEKNK